MNKDMKKTYDDCIKEGFIEPLENIDKEKIISNLQLVEEYLNVIEKIKETNSWSTIYKLSYDTLHTLAESFLMLEKTKSRNHKCLFNYLCQKHQELELNWNFFEKIRTKRNGINYYGTKIAKEDYKEIELQFILYAKTLKQRISEKINEK